MKNREGNYDDGNLRECTQCKSIFTKTSPTVTTCNICNSYRVKSESPEVKMWRRAKCRAKARGHDFNLDKKDIIIPELCPILEFPLVVHSGKSGGFFDSPSLDRINSSKGYVKENVWVISQLANAMKANADESQLIKFANWVLKTY